MACESYRALSEHRDNVIGSLVALIPSRLMSQ